MNNKLFVINKHVVTQRNGKCGVQNTDTHTHAHTQYPHAHASTLAHTRVLQYAQYVQHVQFTIQYVKFTTQYVQNVQYNM